MMRQALARLSSRVARARTVTVMVCVPALPPIEATIGISTARATIFSKASSNRLMTVDARTAVTILANSQGKRLRAVSSTSSDNSSSEWTPPRAFKSSSASSSMTSTTSSIMMTPTKRLLSSTTAAETRL
jgi:hypothetical protein